MSAYRTMLVTVGGGVGTSPSLEAAFGIAARFGAHVIGLHVRVDPALAVPLVGEGMSGAMVEEMMAAAERQATTRAEAARRLFDASCLRHNASLATAPTPGLSAEWVDVTGREEEVVAWRGRLSDLLVLDRPGSQGESRLTMTMNAALMESGRPLLLVPPEMPATLGKRVAIAWNGSAEAGRAVAAALPLLAEAEAVTILSVSEDERTTATPADELAAYLAWHGVSALCDSLGGSSSHTGEALVAECHKLNADLLVMGAYTHSRLRQLILGGATRHVLHHAPLPCLMSH
jgi:nucleotide-binding universal stress UspA family protein